MRRGGTSRADKWVESGGGREIEFGVDQVPFPNHMNGAAKFLKVKVDLKLR